MNRRMLIYVSTKALAEPSFMVALRIGPARAVAEASGLRPPERERLAKALDESRDQVLAVVNAIQQTIHPIWATRNQLRRAALAGQSYLGSAGRRLGGELLPTYTAAAFSAQMPGWTLGQTGNETPDLRGYVRGVPSIGPASHVTEGSDVDSAWPTSGWRVDWSSGWPDARYNREDPNGPHQPSEQERGISQSYDSRARQAYDSGDRQEALRLQEKGKDAAQQQRWEEFQAAAQLEQALHDQFSADSFMEGVEAWGKLVEKLLKALGTVFGGGSAAPDPDGTTDQDDDDGGDNNEDDDTDEGDDTDDEQDDADDENPYDDTEDADIDVDEGPGGRPSEESGGGRSRIPYGVLRGMGHVGQVTPGDDGGGGDEGGSEGGKFNPLGRQRGGRSGRGGHDPYGGPAWERIGPNETRSEWEARMRFLDALHSMRQSMQKKKDPRRGASATPGHGPDDYMPTPDDPGGAGPRSRAATARDLIPRSTSAASQFSRPVALRGLNCNGTG